MARSPFYLALTKGIVHGPQPPKITEIYTIEDSGFPTASIVSMVPPGGPIGFSSFWMTESKNTDLIAELTSILPTLPTESPRGGEDIYGMDISIAWESKDFNWQNGGPEGQGCNVEMHSTVQANDEQKKQFKRAVEIVYELISRADHGTR